MAMQPVIKPQETKPAPLPAYSVAPPSQTQTSARGMVPPRHYDAGSNDVLPQAPSGGTSFHGPAHLLPNYVPYTPPAPPVPVARGPNGRVLYAPPPALGPTASTLMTHAPSALAHAVLGAPGLSAPAAAAPAPPAGPQIPVARGVDTGSLEPGGDGVMLKGQPYASTPQQVATAATNTGVNPAALQNVAGAARDAQVDSGQPQNMGAAPHALANPQQYSSENFVNALRGVSFRHLAMVAGALRTAMPYNPQEQAYQQLLQQRTNVLQGMPHPKLNPEQQKAMGQIEQMEELRAGVFPYQKAYPTPQTDANSNQVDENGYPVQ